MHRYKRLMVGLNLSDQDEATIRYAAMMSRIAKPEKVHFVHFVPRLKIPMSIRLKYPNLFRPVMNDLERVITRHWDRRQSVELVYDVVEGTPLIELPYRSSINAIDLILVGNRREQREIGALPEKLAVEAPCSVLIIPEGTEPKLTKTIVMNANSILPANDPAEAVQKMAREQRADLLVINARATGERAAVLSEPIIRKLVRTVEMPLLIMREENNDAPALEAAPASQDEVREASSDNAVTMTALSYAA